MKKRILLAENPPSVAHILEGKLVQLNVEVIVANNGGLALEHLQNGMRFDLIISDIVVPKVDGIPFVFLTSYMANVKAQNLDPDLVLRKPVEAEDLKKIIENILF